MILPNVPGAADAAETLLSIFSGLFIVLLLSINTVTDVKTMRIAPKPTYVLAFALLLLRTVLMFCRKESLSAFLFALMASLAPGLLLKFLSLISPRMIGGGDGTVIIALGCATSLDTILAILFFSFLCAGFYGIILLFRRRGVKAEFPFMPFLSLGTAAAGISGFLMRYHR